jgi:hypothetical protein
MNIVIKIVNKLFTTERMRAYDVQRDGGVGFGLTHTRWHDEGRALHHSRLQHMPLEYLLLQQRVVFILIKKLHHMLSE